MSHLVLEISNPPRSSKDSKDRRFFKSAQMIPKRRSSENFMDFQKNFIAAKKSIDYSSDINDSESKEDKENPLVISKQEEKIKENQVSNTVYHIKKLASKKNITKTIINTSQILTKKFITLLKRNANLNTILSPKIVSFLQDLSYFHIPSEFSTRKKGKLGLMFNWIKKKATPFFVNEKNKNFWLKIKKSTMRSINPFDRMKIFWDIFLFVNTLLMFFYIPLTLSFQFLNDSDRDTFHYTEFVVYIFDLCINFNTGYIDNGVVVKERKKILKNYLKGVLVFDIVAMISLIAKNEDFYNGDGDPNDKFLFFQLFFFALFPSLQAKFNRIKEYFCLDSKVKGFFLIHKLYISFINIGILDLIVLLVTSLFFSHLFACFFHLIAVVSPLPKTWLTNYGLITQPLMKQYLYSLYWSTITIMTVGYGDIVPQNPREIGFTLITVILGCIVFGYNLNKIASIFQEMNEGRKKIQSDINKINKFMESKNIDSTLQMRIRAYLKFVWENQNDKLNNEVLGIIDLLSDPLKKELYLHSYGKNMRNHPLLQSDTFSEEFLSSVIRYTEEENFMKNDQIYIENENKNLNLYYIVSGGVNLYNVVHQENHPVLLKSMKEKEFFGDYSFITGMNPVFSARAAEFTKVYKISHEKFIATLRNFPEDYEKYCEIRDKFILYQDFSKSNLRCFICLRKDHLSNSCPLVHYIANQKSIVLRHVFSNDMERKPLQRKRKKLNSLNIKKKIIIAWKTFGKGCQINSDDNFSDSCSEVNISQNVISSSQNDLLFDNLSHQSNSNHDINNIGSNNYVNANDNSQFHTIKNKLVSDKELPIFRNTYQYLKDPQEPQEPKELKEPKEPKEPKELKEPKEDERNLTLITSFKPSENDLELVKTFNNYFPDSNIAQFIGKYRQNRKLFARELKRKKNKELSKSNRKSGYGLISFADDCKSLNNLSPNRKLKNNSKGFFSVNEGKQLNFIELVRELRTNSAIPQKDQKKHSIKHPKSKFLTFHKAKKIKC